MRRISLALILAALFAPLAGADERQFQPEWTDGTLWESGDYVYDAAGNILAIGNDSYRYDSLSRLKTATAKTPGNDGNAQEFSYDRYGNILTATTAPSSLITGMAVNSATNQINGDCPTGVSQCIRAGFDAVGNQISLDGTLNQYLWDDLGMLAERSITGQRTRYLYDANDERIAILSLDSQGAVTGTRYTLRGADNKVTRELLETSGTLTWSKDYVYRGSALLAAFVNGENGPGPHRHYHLDHLGTPRLITDSGGYKLARHTYWPFGREATGSELDNERMTFTGHERDSAGPGAEGMDLDYMHARFYDPTQGRFLSVDPTWESADFDAPQSWNRYTYTLNNPVLRIDPDGRLHENPRQLHPKVYAAAARRLAQTPGSVEQDRRFWRMMGKVSLAGIAATAMTPRVLLGTIAVGLGIGGTKASSEPGATPATIAAGSADGAANAVIVRGAKNSLDKAGVLPGDKSARDDGVSGLAAVVGPLIGGDAIRDFVTFDPNSIPGGPAPGPDEIPDDLPVHKAQPKPAPAPSRTQHKPEKKAPTCASRSAC